MHGKGAENLWFGGFFDLDGLAEAVFLVQAEDIFGQLVVGDARAHLATKRLAGGFLERGAEEGVEDAVESF